MRPAALVALFPIFACSHDSSSGPGTAAMRSQSHGRARKEPRGAEHDVYSLIDNRLYAHVERGGGLVIVPGSAGFGKYGRTAAQIVVPLTEAQAASGQLFVRSSTPSPRALTIVANGRPAAFLPGAPTAVTLHPGENVLELEPATEVSWLQLGGAPPGDRAPTTYDPSRRALVLDDGVALVWYLAVPPGARLRGDVGGAGCTVTASARTASGAQVDGVLAGDAGAVDLGALAGQVVRLRLAAAGCRSARLSSAALALPGPTALVQRRQRPRNIVLWIMDSLRADKVNPLVAGARPEVPGFAALAEKGVVFTNATAQGNESRASYASIWTSLYPANHGMIDGEATLDPRLASLGPAMKSAGLTTAGATGNGYIAARWGFIGDGWDSFMNRIHDEGSTRGDDLLAAGLAAANDPFFLYLGTIDTHVSWRAKEPWLRRYDPRPYDGPYRTIALGRDVERMAAGTLSPSERDKQHIIALYDSNVSFQDDLLGKLEAKLAERGIAGDTMIVVTADHGDELWEDGRVGHGGSLAETLVHVPLVIVYPPLFPARSVVTEEVELVDLLPTLLDAEGMAPLDGAQGASLVPLAQGQGRGYPRGAVATQFETAHALRLFGWKAWLGSSGAPKIFHIADDPGEKTDLAGARPLERRFLTDILFMHLAHRKEWRKSRWGAVANVSARMADDLERSYSSLPSSSSSAGASGSAAAAARIAGQIDR